MLDISIKDPMTQGEGMKSYTSYKIVVKVRALCRLLLLGQWTDRGWQSVLFPSSRLVHSLCVSLS